jgi:anti-anti-sigma factor
LTEQPVVWRVRLALHLPPAGHDRPSAEGIEVIPVAALRTSASAGADGPIVALSGEADATTAVELRETLATQLDTGARRVTVDASGLSFPDSASLRVLVLAARQCGGATARWCSRGRSR